MREPVVTLLLGEIAAALPAIGGGLVIIFASWVIAVVARAAIDRIAPRFDTAAGRGDVLRLAASILYWTILAFGLVMGLGTMGIRIEPLVAGLGLTGFALGFALRDAISNLLAGVLILTYRPFRYGDRISVTGFEGVVVHIDLRYTTLSDGSRTHLIPNQTMYSNPVTVIAAPSATAAAPSD